jgi:hypothetical protein
MSKIIDVGIPETPAPLALANISNGTPLPLKNAIILNVCMYILYFHSPWLFLHEAF